MTAQEFGAMDGIEHVVGAQAAPEQPLLRRIGDVGRNLAAAFPLDAIAVDRVPARRLGIVAEPEHRALPAAGDKVRVREQKLDRARQTLRNEEVVVVGHHDKRRRHPRERVGKLRVVGGVVGVVRIADVLDVQPLRFRFGHGARDRRVGAAVGDQDVVRQRRRDRVRQPSVRERHAISQRQQDGEMGRRGHFDRTPIIMRRKQR
jgi:hypothetical protein